jgi:iron complex outermembrane receptor protein
MDMPARYLLAGLAWLAGPVSSVSAQTVEPDQLERVEIVGSHLKRLDQQGAAPVSVYTRDAIAATGVERLSDFLMALPMAGAEGLDDRRTLLSSAFGSAGLSLRGLGPGATLVLLNGHRIAAYGITLDDDSNYVDLNSLPLAAVERVEVLRDGASALYGADAIGGVVNVVLKHDYSGAEAGLRVGSAWRGDSARTAATLAAGRGALARDGYNAFFSLEAAQQQATPSTARDFTSSSDKRPFGGSDFRSLRSYPPTFRLPGHTSMAAPNCPSEQIEIVSGPSGPGSACMFDAAPYMDLLPAVHRVGALGVVQVAAGPDWRLFAEGLANRSQTVGHAAPAPIQSMLPPDAPTNPFGSAVTVFWRPVDAGPRRFETDNLFGHALLGAEGAAAGWDWSLVLGASRIRTAVHQDNQLRTSATVAALRSGALDPLKATNDPAVLASVKADAVDHARGEAAFAQLQASRVLTRLSQGAVELALGVELRRESYATGLDPLTLSGDLAASSGAGTADARAGRSVRAAYAELSWPLLRGLELQLAARTDRYSDFGGSTSPRLALRWQPHRAWLLRASAGRGFKPPTLAQLNRPRSAFIDGDLDPIRCPVTKLPEDCQSAEWLHTQQGNSALGAERSHQHNLGVVWEPAAGQLFGLDAWRVLHLGRIVFGDRYLLANEAAFPGAVVRDAPSAADRELGLPGPIVELHDSYMNLARHEVRGMDMEIKSRLGRPGGGELGVDGLLSYLVSDRLLVAPLAVAQEQAGGDHRPRLRAQLGASWRPGAWQFAAGLRHFSGYGYVDSVGQPGRMAAWMALDLQVAYTWGASRLQLGVRNLLDREPPRRNSATGFDAGVHDPMGRSWSAGWRQAF